MTPVSPPGSPRGAPAQKAHPPWRAMLLGLVIGVAVTLAPVPSGANANPGAPGAAAIWQWPVPSPRVLLRGYEAPATRYAAGHRGIDVQAAIGSPITSPADGVVSFAGHVVDRGVLSIRHDGGIVSSFEPVDALVAAGQRVRAGEAVGTVAASPHCAGCVHVGARRAGEYLSPLALLGGVPRAVLLPLDG